VISRRIRTIDVAEFALKTQINDGFRILGLEFGDVYLGILFLCAVPIHGVEEFRKAATELDTKAAVGTELENTLNLRAEVSLIPEFRVDRIIRWGFLHCPRPFSGSSSVETSTLGSG
jgi:hypothetical protein